MLKASPLKHVKRGRDIKIPQSSGPPVKVGDEAVHKELGDRMEKAAITTSSLEAEQESGIFSFAKNTLMQNRGATNLVSPMHSSTLNPMQSGGDNSVEVDGQSSQYEHEYINIDDDTVPTQDTNEETGERDIGNNNAEDEVELK
ncbi:hypothetical protein Tco_1341371, partial [Tanacetum coccineum]